MKNDPFTVEYLLKLFASMVVELKKMGFEEKEAKELVKRALNKTVNLTANEWKAIADT